MEILKLSILNIDANSGAFGATRVSFMTLHWDQEEILNIPNAFDVIIASERVRKIIKCESGEFSFIF